MLMSLGCGSSSGKVAHLQGKITIKGAALPADAEGVIAFTPTTPGVKGASVPIKDSAYDSPETPIGRVRVGFQITQPVGPTKVSEHGGNEYREKVNLVPQGALGGLELEVTGDKADQDFNL
jgi:hypothetical protein